MFSHGSLVGSDIRVSDYVEALRHVLLAVKAGDVSTIKGLRAEAVSTPLSVAMMS